MVTVPRVKLLWATWDLRIVILFSLVLQIFLIFFAPLRKRVSTAWITTSLWFAYLLADVVANFAVGLISKSQGDTSGPFANPTLLAFWAPFLLLHLGGPDTITAFALEDNELWLRHLFGLGFQCWAVAYAFFLSFPNHKFWLPTLLMFVSGVIKYTERTRAFYLASSRKFKTSLLTKPDPGPNYVKLLDEMKSNTRLQKKIEWIPESTRVNRSRTKEDWKELSDLKVVQVAHQYFSVFNGLIADSIFSFRERNLTRDFFLKRTARDAFKVVEVELNFFYEILYTKATVVQGIPGYLLRILSLSLNFATAVIFYLIDKKEFEKVDVGISYSLLLGAIALDLTASIIVLYSDWTIVALTKSGNPNWFIQIVKRLLKVERVRRPKTPRKPRCFPLGTMKIVRRFMRLRWSQSLSKYNLLNYCLHPRGQCMEATITVFGLTNMLDAMEYVERAEFTNDMRNLIFNELKKKSELADTLEIAKEIFLARGDWILERESCKDLLRWIKEVDFDESLILWHIATDLCYYTNANDGGNPTSFDTINSVNKDIPDYRELSKLLSDYMLYLLILQSTMLSDVAGIGQTRFRDTCAEAKRFFREKKNVKSEEENKNAIKTKKQKKEEEKNTDQEKRKEEKNHCLSISNLGKCFCDSYPDCCSNKCCSKGEREQDELQKEACRSILDVDTSVEPFAVKRDRSKSILFDACMLAKELKKLEKQRMWEIISKVWVELMCYAACRCRATTHMAQLSKGGQLLTLVWLLMVHLGLSDHYQIREGHARAKLIVKM